MYNATLIGLRACTVLIVLLAAGACGRQDPDNAARIAMDAVTRFHAQLTQGRYVDLCQAAEPGAIFPENVPGKKQSSDGKEFRPFPHATCPEHLTYVHDKLGNVVDARRTQLPNVGTRKTDGAAMVGLDYATRYDRGEAREHFEWRINGETAILAHYQIVADALNP